MLEVFAGVLAALIVRDILRAYVAHRTFYWHIEGGSFGHRHRRVMAFADAVAGRKT